MMGKKVEQSEVIEVKREIPEHWAQIYAAWLEWPLNQTYNQFCELYGLNKNTARNYLKQADREGRQVEGKVGLDDQIEMLVYKCLALLQKDKFSVTVATNVLPRLLNYLEKKGADVKTERELRERVQREIVNEILTWAGRRLCDGCRVRLLDELSVDVTGEVPGEVNEGWEKDGGE